MKYKVWYQINEKIRERGERPFEEREIPFLLPDHHYMITVEADSMEDVFMGMNAPNNPLGDEKCQEDIGYFGINHTSMSINDVIVDEDGRKFRVANFGFQEVTE